MNLDKTIKDLMNRIDEVYPASSTTNGGISHDGIHYWKGKKIISAKDWNELYEKNSTHTDDTYKTTLTSRKPLQYFPDDYNGSISLIGVVDKLKEEIQQWNIEYYELLEFRKNPTLGRRKCSGCIFSGHLDDPLFVGIEQVIARIVSNQCNTINNTTTTINNKNENLDLVTYPCNVMNFYKCPFDNNFQNSYTKEVLFTVQRIAFTIELAISTFFGITKDNEIIYEVDFENDRVQEIHTKYNGEPENWGWINNVKEQLSKVKPISNIIIRNEEDIYTILTNKEKLNFLFKEYYEQYQKRLKESEEQQQQIILNEEKRHNIVSFILDNNKDPIKIDDLKINEPIYKCYRARGNCIICNSLSNIICINCTNYSWLCTNHWQEHATEKHIPLLI